MSAPIEIHRELNEAVKLKSKKLGRAARRRKSKARSIHMALQSLLRGEQEGEDNIVNEESQLPSDRSHSLPGVIVRRQEKMQNPESAAQQLSESSICTSIENDKAMLVSQLGYMPGNAIGVVGRTQDLKTLYPELYQVLQKFEKSRAVKGTADKAETDIGKEGKLPTALQLYPLVVRNVHTGGKSGRKFKSRKRVHGEIVGDSTSQQKVDAENLAKLTELNDAVDTQDSIMVLEPFPTMYWLTHPLLKTLISQLEIGTINNVIEMEKKLKSCTKNLEQMKLAHKQYGETRWLLLTEEDKDDVRKRKWTDAVGSVRGVAGIRKHDTIKCLHTHCAHYLAYLGAQNEVQNPNTEVNLVGKWVLEAVEEAVKEMQNE